MTTAATTRLLTLDEAADRLGVSIRFIRRLRHERRLTFIKLGKHLRIDNNDLDAYIEACREAVEPSPIGVVHR
jgi:excisionase family DNA binding protein